MDQDAATALLAVISEKQDMMIALGRSIIAGLAAIALAVGKLTHMHYNADNSGFGTIRVKELLEEIVTLVDSQGKSAEATTRSMRAVQRFLIELANRVGALNGTPNVMPDLDTEDN